MGVGRSGASEVQGVGLVLELYRLSGGPWSGDSQKLSATYHTNGILNGSTMFHFVEHFHESRFYHMSLQTSRSIATADHGPCHFLSSSPHRSASGRRIGRVGSDPAGEPRTAARHVRCKPSSASDQRIRPGAGGTANGR